jgi:hypothetical protein
MPFGAGQVAQRTSFLYDGRDKAGRNAAGRIGACSGSETLRTRLGNKKPQASACRTHRHGPAPPNACEADVLLICQERESSDSPMLKAF